MHASSKLHQHSYRLSLLTLAWVASLLAATAAVQIAVNRDRYAAIGDRLASFSCCQTITPVMDSVVSVLVGAVVTAIGGGIGRRLIGRRGTDAERAALSVGIGLGALSAATLALGLVGLLRAEIGALLMFIVAVVFFRSIRVWMRDIRSALDALSTPSRLSRWSLAFCAMALTFSFLQALAPATAWDSLVYHLKGPELYLASGRIDLPFDLPYLGFPQFQEMLFLLARLIGAPNVASLHWVFAAATVLLVHSAARRIWGESNGWIAAAIFLSSQTIASLAGWPYVDLTLAFHVTAAFACIEHYRDDADPAWLRLAGAFTGFAMATKYTAVPAVAGLVIAVCAGSGPERRFLSRLIQFLVFAVLAALPWYLKNWVTTGNPVYPFLFDAPYWDAYRAGWYGRFGTGLAFTAPVRLLTAPIEATIFGVEGHDPYAATIGALYLMFVPVGFIIGRRLRPIRDMVIVCGVAYLGWLAMIAGSALLVQTRLLFPVFPLLAVTAADGVEALRRSERLTFGVRRLVSLVIVASLALTAFGLVAEFGNRGILSILGGGQSSEAYRVSQLGWYALAMQEINRLPVGARVLFLWEPRSLYCRIDCRPDALLDRWWHDRRIIGSAGAIAATWRDRGITHVLFHRKGYEFIVDAEFDPISDDDQLALAELIDSRLALVRDVGGAYQLYAWRAENTP